MDSNSIKAPAAKFIAAAQIEQWSQEVHNAFIAWLLKRELALTQEQVDGLMEWQKACPALMSNASALRQKFEGKGFELLKPREQTSSPASRYAALINAD